jgi:hypothetical protein
MKSITFGELTIEARTEVIKEAVESTAWSLEKSEKELEFLRARLEEQKKALGHGKWLPWIRETFGQDDAAIQKIQRFLRKPNTSLLTYLPETTVQNNTETQERIPNRVTVVESTSEVGQPSVQADDDPPPNPPTNRKVSAVSKKVSESTKTPTAVITPEIVTDTAPAGDPIREWIKSHTVADLLSMMVDGTDEASKKTTAKQLRKLADKLDPPSVGAPSIEAVEAWATENGLPDFDVEKFYNHYELAAWKYGKAKTPIKDWKRAALNAYASGKGWAVDGANRLPF